MIYAWQRSPWNHIRLSCMCQTGNNKGRKAPSWLVHIQASLNLGRILLAIAGSLAGISRIRRTSACQQQLMSMATCTHASSAGWAPWRKRQPTESEWQSTPSQRPSTGSAHPNRKHHRGDKEHQPATTPNTPATASMLAMRAAQSETIPPALRFSIPTGHSVPRSFLSLWCVHSYGLWRRGTRYEAHGNSQTYGIWIQDKPLWETPWNCIMTRS